MRSLALIVNSAENCAAQIFNAWLVGMDLIWSRPVCEIFPESIKTILLHYKLDNSKFTRLKCLWDLAYLRVNARSRSMNLAMTICSDPFRYDDCVKVERKRLRGLFRRETDRVWSQVAQLQETGYWVGWLQQPALKTMAIIKVFGSCKIMLSREKVAQYCWLPAMGGWEQKKLINRIWMSLLGR